MGESYESSFSKEEGYDFQTELTDIRWYLKCQLSPSEECRLSGRVQTFIASKIKKKKKVQPPTSSTPLIFCQLMSNMQSKWLNLLKNADVEDLRVLHPALVAF